MARNVTGGGEKRAGGSTNEPNFTRMQLFAGSSEEFIEEAVQARIAERLGNSYYDYYRMRATASEFNSWKNSLAALANQLRYSSIRDHGVILEMQLPL
ncbi:MAG: hypothetical protein ACYDA1_10405, partial [Vulcanimicrobiaceae bacterium]